MTRIPAAAVLAAILAMATAPPGLAQPAPQADASSASAAVPYERFLLSNGLTVLVYTDRTVPSVFVGVYYRTGSKDEPAGKSGFAHLFEHLMFQQTANRPGEYLEIMGRAGATGLNGETGTDSTSYYQTVPTNALDMALWMESDRMGHLAGGITQAVLDEQRRVVKNEKRQGEMEGNAAYQDRFLAAFYPPGHPYAHSTIGSMEDLDAATLDDVKHWFDTHYGPDNAVLVLSGDIDAATAREKAERYFGGLPARGAPGRVLQWVPDFTDVRRDLVRIPGGDGVISRSWALPNDDQRQLALLQLAAVTMTGVREAPFRDALTGPEGVAAEVQAGVEPGALVSRLTLSMALRPGVDPAVANRALDAALADYFATGPTASGLRSVVAGTDMANLRASEGATEVGMQLAQGELQGDPTLFLKQRDWIAEATADEVRAVAARWMLRPHYEQWLLPPPAADAAPARADVDRTAMPQPGALKTDILFPDVTEMRLANGLRVVVAERHRLPVVDATLQFDTGSEADAAYAPGAGAAAFGLLTRGSTASNAAVLAARSSDLGVPLVGQAGPRRSSFVWNALTSRLDEAFALASEVIRDPAYPADDVAAAAAGTRQRLSGTRDAAASADRLLAQAIWGDDDPRGRRAAAGDFDALDRAAVARFHAREIGPANAVLYLVGDVTPDRARQLAESHFGDWRRNEPAAVPTRPDGVPQRPRVVLVDAPGAVQSSITVGSPAPPFDPQQSTAESLATAALASMDEGRLNRRLREEKGWTYGFGGAVDGGPTGQRLFTAGGTVETERTAEAMDEIRRIVGAFVSSEPMTADELTVSRDAALRSGPIAMSTNAAIMRSMIGSAGMGLPYDRIRSAGDRYNAVTLEDVRLAADRLYRPDALTWVVVGDLSVIEPAIRALDLGPVEVRDAAGQLLR